MLDVENNARVCLVDGDAAKTLFFGEDPVGQTFYLDGFEYTVVGMIEIFGAQAPAGGNPQQLAHGISVALYNTALGLMVAIPAMIGHRFFRARVDTLLVELERQSLRMVDAVRLASGRNARA